MRGGVGARQDSRPFQLASCWRAWRGSGSTIGSCVHRRRPCVRAQITRRRWATESAIRWAPCAERSDSRRGLRTGRDLDRFVTAGHRPIGIDLNPAFVAMASDIAPVIEGDLRELESYFGEGSFDAVWASASLVHLDDSETLGALQAFRTVLRRRGRLYACVMSQGRTGWLEEPDGRRWYRAWHVDEFAALIESAGFGVDDVTDGPYVEVWATQHS